MSQNQLADATSPYLLQHAANPVHWRQWGPPALAEAKRRDCPLLISIGYAACHWCHVMAHESFEDPVIAALMNERFVNIKIDREERPDIDHVYMSALHAMGEQGGWPLTMFAAPDGAPMFGGTYWPPEARWGRPSFKQILDAVDRAWRDKRPALLAQGVELLAHIAAQTQANPGGDIGPADLDRAAVSLLRLTDPINGGIGDAPKFPNAPIFRFLWSEHFRTGDALAGEAVHRLLSALCAGGIYDHLGGGFARYSTDAQWHVPHFEKMLYDNAQILELLALAHARRPSPIYAERARQTFEWLMREMRVGDAFAAAQDADQEGEEGKFFVWTSAEIETALGPAAPAFCAAYDVRKAGNWEGRNVLRRLTPLGSPDEEAALAKARTALFALREARAKPARDDKVLADWNALMIVALARASAAFDAPDFLDAARKAFAFLDHNLRDDKAELIHSWRAQRMGAAAFLDDYAALACAALALFEASGERALLARAVALALEARTRFGAPDGGYYMTSEAAHDAPGARPRLVHDGVCPSGLSLMAQALVRLYHLTGSPQWREAALGIFRSASGAAQGLAQSPSLLAAADFLERGELVVVTGELDNATAAALAQVALAWGDPATCVLRAGASPDWPQDSPAHGKIEANASPAAYVCRGSTCSLPVATPEALRQALARANIIQ